MVIVYKCKDYKKSLRHFSLLTNFCSRERTMGNVLMFMWECGRDAQCSSGNVVNNLMMVLLPALPPVGQAMLQYEEYFDLILLLRETNK